MPETTVEASPSVKAQKKPPAQDKPDGEIQYRTLVARIQPANHRADGAGFATHLHCQVESIKRGKVIDHQSAQGKIVNREEPVPVPIKVHPDADELGITITSLRFVDGDDMETLELSRHQNVMVKDLHRGPLTMPLFHQSKVAVIPPPATILVDDLCDHDGESLIAKRERVVAEEQPGPTYRIDDSVSTIRGVGTIVDFKRGTTIPKSGFVHGSTHEANDSGEPFPTGAIVVVKVADDLVDFYAADVKPYHMTGQG